ncbi:hypothetical protein K469DRAFT_607087 [Zopfia rhizophila CBS 207.26]|uniref:Oxidase ustYa n=1 Tax=Zopfia rhizophila CBS 207.26 TaxID=1314779 RepID=A0A6A6DA99_9PEZI|nr:hypothetical protein K469DRAFT_607087 [Zopfia rhizophila CBS 207.26]
MTSRPLYQEVALEDVESSSTEIESLVGEKDGRDARQPRTRTRVLRHGRRARWWIVHILLLAIIVGLLIERYMERIKAFEITGDVTGFAPRFSLKVMSFEPDLDFVPENTSSFWDDKVRDKWLSIVPRGLGYVRVDNPSAYHDLPIPIHDYKNMTVFTTSMPHQLHCLYNILEVYSAVTSGNPHKVPTEMTFHLQHCFEYLRLSIMCCGDVALEGAQSSFPAGFPGSDGWDAKHVCRNYDEVYEYLDENRATDRVWIGGADDIH